MLTELEGISAELRTDKILTRQKAFNKLDTIINTRSGDLKIFLEDSQFISFTDLFNSAHEGILKQCAKWAESNTVIPENDTKLLTHAKVMQKLVSLANDDENRISARILSSKIVEVFLSKVTTKFFGQYYLQILQKHILNSKTSIAELKTSHWTDLLEQGFRLLKRDFPNINKTHVSQCVQQIIELSTKYSHLGSDELSQFMANLEKCILENTENGKLLIELLKVSYFCCKGLVVRFRFLVCEFTEKIMKLIHKVWDKSLNDDSKTILYKLMDLILICHTPVLNEDRESLASIQNKEEYNTQLRNFKFIVDTEIRTSGVSKYRSNTSVEINFFLRKFAARLSYALYWDESTTQASNENGEQSSKRQRTNKKLQKVMEFVTKDDSFIDWKWFTVLGDLLFDHPNTLIAEDFQPLLHVLTTFQAQMENTSQILAFTKVCFVMLKHENYFMENYNGIVKNYCDENWNKITENVLRNCTSNNKFATEYHKLLQILLYYKKLPSTSFAMEIMNFFFSNVFVKNDVTLKTLIAVFENFNMDSTNNSKELSLKVLNFLLEKQNIGNLKSVIMNTSKPSLDVVGKLIVICCLSKTDVYNLKRGEEFLSEFAKNLDGDKDVGYTEEVNELIQLILLKMNYKLLIETMDLETENSNQEENSDIKCIIDEAVLDQVPQLISKSVKVLTENPPENELVNHLKNLLENAGIVINMMDQFFKYQAMNSNNWRLEKFIVKKIIPFNLQEIDQVFSLINANYKLDLKDTNEILVSLQRLFNPNLHQIVCKLVRSGEIKNLLEWTISQIQNEFCTYEPNTIGKEEFEAAKAEKKIKMKALEILITYLKHKDLSGVEFVIDAIKGSFFEYYDNVEVHTIFHVIRLLADLSSVPRGIVAWSFVSIQKICEIYKNHNYISEEVIKLFGSIFKLSSSCPDTNSMTILIYRAFLTKCSKEVYSPKHTVECLNNIESFHKQFFHMYDQNDVPVPIVYDLVIDLLASPIFTIKLAAIEAIAAILDTNTKDINFQNLLHGKNLQNEIYEKISMEKLLESENLNCEDSNKNRLAISLHFVSSIMCVNHLLRRKLVFKLGQTIVLNKISEDEGKMIFKKILNGIKCDSKSLMDHNTVLALTSYWVKNEFNFSLIPWYFTEASSIKEFYQEYQTYIYMAMWKNDIKIFEHFCNEINEDIKEKLLEIMPSALAYLVPFYAKCPAVLYKSNAQKCDRYLTNQNMKPNSKFWKKNIVEIVEKILEIVYDREYFEKITKCPLHIQVESEMIKKSDFDLCLHYIKSEMYPNDSSEFFIICCKVKPYISERLLTSFKAKIQNSKIKEQKMLHFMQYCLIIEYFANYLRTKLTDSDLNIKKYIIKEVMHFYCYLISDEASNFTRINHAASCFLEKFFNQILPMCADYFRPYMSLAVSTLIAVCKRPNVNSDFRAQCLKLLEILTIKHATHLKKEIGNLDNFPSDTIFSQLRENHLSIKYDSREFSLNEEIEHFLAVGKRSIEALVCLRENLASKKDELRDLFSNLSELKRSSQEIESSILRRLINVLVSHINGADQERAVEAVKCLGEIGAYDLVGMVFNYGNVETSTLYYEIKSLTTVLEMSYKIIVQELIVLVSNPNPEVFQNAISTLYKLLSIPSLKKYSTPETTPFTNARPESEQVFSQPEHMENFIAFLNKEEYSPYFEWVQKFCSLILSYLSESCAIREVAEKVPLFAEKIFHVLFQILLVYKNAAIHAEVVKTINFFFERHNDIQKSMVESIYLNKFAIKIMLNVAEIIRIFHIDNPSFDSNISLNYLLISKAAHYCQAEFTAVMYCELWAQDRKDRENIQFKESLINKDLQETVNEAYLSIGIKEAADVFVNPAKSRSNYLQLHGDIHRMILETDAQMTVTTNNDIYRQALLDAGLYNLSKIIPSETPQYECFWRLSDWSILIEKDFDYESLNKASDFQREFERSHYTALKCLNNRDELGTTTSILKARKAVIQLLNRSSLECSKNLYKFIAMSQQLQQIEDFCDIQFKSSENHIKMVKKWEEQDKTPYNHFNYIEPVLAQRNCILSTASIKAGRRTWVPEVLQNNFLYIIKHAKETEDCKNIALKNIANMKNLGSALIPEKEAELFLEDSQISWKLNDKTLAKNLLVQVVNKKQFANLLQKSEAFRLHGEYVAESYSEDIKIINENYFMQSVKMLTTHAQISGNSQMLDTNSQRDLDYNNPEGQKMQGYLNIYETVAKYHDRDYTEICQKMKNPSHQKKIENIPKTEAILEKLKSEIPSLTGEARKDKNTTYLLLIRNKAIDEREIKQMDENKEKAATQAALYYVRHAIVDPSMNLLSIFRIISLWLNNQDFKSIQLLLQERSKCISSHKFIEALPQLSSRISENNEETRNTLNEILERCAKEHPHHTLNYLLSFFNSNVDSKETNVEIESRKKIATQILSKLAKDSEMGKIIEQYQQMSKTLIEFANLEVRQIPADHQILKIKNFTLVQCPTLNLPISPKHDYQNKIVSVAKWGSKMCMVGGINAPKKIDCHCSDGVIRPQLLKAKDDLRQDAVMQQVFNIMNGIFKEDKETKRHDLKIRTYKILPLSRRSGILEWCENCIPIGKYLITDDAHSRLRPNDLKYTQCLDIMTEFDGLSSKQKLEKYEDMCKRFHPVFHHFFLENFFTPGIWFESRLKYTKSVATTSIVGYILGIGDRHVQNIMIDRNTGEVVHIDFGIAFEQGKILPHPETIPFRLTRDIIAPFGVCGVNGIFRKLCEKILAILRQNDQIIITILEVLLYDPLYAWAMTSNKAKKYQDQSIDLPEEQMNTTASRALMRVEEKLRGQDEKIGYCSIEGQVDRLFREATNPANLCKLFKGFQPYV